MPPDEPNLEEYDAPFRPAPGNVDDTYPTTDTDQDQTELYQQGIDVQEPNAGSSVEGYNPAKDQRLTGKR